MIMHALSVAMSKGHGYRLEDTSILVTVFIKMYVTQSVKTYHLLKILDFKILVPSCRVVYALCSA